jgi:GTPase
MPERRPTQKQEPTAAVARAVLLAADTGDHSFSPQESVAELGRLAETAGVQVAGTCIQHLPAIQPGSYLGKGKIRELFEEKSNLRFDTVIADDELTSSQQRFLEDTLNVQVLDRTALILHIFAMHARSREGRLQVELAQYRYRLPHLSGRGVELSRLGGGINTRGPGETKLESDRRRIRTRIAALNREIQRVREQRALYRRQRRLSGVPVVALVGYTNSGKSTLMNALTGAGVWSSDRLFATLDPTTRRIELPDGQHVLLTDTVGFIQKLPTDLIAAFRATLEEIVEADLIVHLLDASHANVGKQADAVEDELEDLGITEVPKVIALNKVDLVSPERLGMLHQTFPESVPVSALKRTGLDGLRTQIGTRISEGFVSVRVAIPYDETGFVNLFRSRGMVEREVHRPEGTIITGKLPASLLPSFRAFLC